jgi:rSAM/selenodomain-associated transferase 1
MTPGLALFVKTPGRSPVKSRLWPAIGREAAEALYLDCATAVGETAIALQRDGRLHAYWAVAETGTDHAAVSDPWQALPVIAQRDGGLGERMAHVYATLRARHGAALLIGTDLPQLSMPALADAVDALVHAKADLVLGPSEDGGFWLVGGRVDPPLAAWTAPRYSTPDALSDFLAALPQGLRVHLLDTAHDLDEPGDLAVVAAALAALPRRTEAQERVSRRLDALLATMPR